MSEEIKLTIHKRSELLNNPDALGYAVIARKGETTIFEKGMGSYCDTPYKTKAKAQLFVDNYHGQTGLCKKRLED